jgi:hypothetical protein
MIRTNGGLLALAFFIFFVCAGPLVLQPGRVPASSPISGQETAVTKISVPSLPPRSSEMRLLRSFPAEKDEVNDVFLTQAHYFSADSNGRIYVSDVKAGQVFVFEKDGRFVTKIGRPGQGPGEFNLVGRPLPTSRGLAVLDRSNSRIQYFDDRGRFAGSLRLAKSCGDMAIGTDGTAFVLSTPNVSGEMISAISADGQTKATFGLPPQALLSKTSVHVCWPKMGPGDELFIAYWFLPFVQVYSSAGELRSVFEFQYRPIQERLAKNEAQAKAVPGGGRAIGEAIIEAIDVDENGFYILYRGKRTEILEFRRDGTFVRTYWTAQAPDYYPRGLLVLNDGGQRAFYLLQIAPENKVDVFIEK